MTLPIRKKIFDVVGEAQTNDDGTPRQEIIFKCEPGDIVSLVREPNNPYDENAIRIDWKHKTVGYIQKLDAAKLSPILDDGRKHKAIIHKLKGGIRSYENYGIEISIAWDDKPNHPYVSLDDEQEAYREKQGEAGGCLGVIILFICVFFVINLSGNAII